MNKRKNAKSKVMKYQHSSATTQCLVISTMSDEDNLGVYTILQVGIHHRCPCMLCKGAKEEI